MGLDRIGTFRCKPLEWVIDGKVPKNSKDGKKLPWFNVKVFLTEVYDAKEGRWFDYTEFEGEITAYQCLYGAIKAKGGEIGPTLSMDQIKKVFNWDGRSLIQLVNGDYNELGFQVRIGENTYEAATYPYQVNWIDVYDAEPGQQLRKLDAKELKVLDKQFSALGVKTATPKTAAKAPAKIHPARVPADDAAPPTAVEKAALAAKSAKNLAAKKTTTSPPATQTASTAPPPKPAKTTCTVEEAWEAVLQLRDPTISDDVVTKVWQDSIAE
ncbi:hypothetical protein KA005_21490, partial [bacterium]|nr:hypothetical protein [bacterium]